MWSAIFPYYSLNDHIGFLRFKQQYIHNNVGKSAFYAHVFTAVFCLTFGLVQFSKTVLVSYPGLHRVIGRLYPWNILAINFRTGMILAVTAVGPLISKLGFVTLDCLWWWFTYTGVALIRKKRSLLTSNL